MDVELPRLADTLVEGTVARWLKPDGARVTTGEPLVEIETDKVTSEVESPGDGVLQVVVAAGETVPVGTVIARLEPAEGAAAAAPGEATAAGVHHAMTGAAPAGGMSSMRRRIAERMQEARAKISQGACVREVDLSRIDRGGRSWTAYFVKALAGAAEVDSVGVAVEVPDGLLVPVVRDVRSRSLDEVAAAIADVARRAREGHLQPAEVTGSQFTVTNVGGGGTLMAFPLVPPGEPGILAPGAIRDGRCYVTLCYDRAAYDDWAADRLLERIAAGLEAAGA